MNKIELKIAITLMRKVILNF